MPERNESAKTNATIARAFTGNQWVEQLRSEGARADQAEAALLAVQDATADVMLIALSRAQVLLEQARDTAQDVLSVAEADAMKLLEVAQVRAEQLLLASELEFHAETPTMEERRLADASAAALVVFAAQADAAASLRHRQMSAADVLLRERPARN